jgi:hypothetical protein
MFSNVLLTPDFLQSVISHIDTEFLLIPNVLFVITIDISQVLTRYTFLKKADTNSRNISE